MPKIYYATPHYFATLTIPMRAGRDFGTSDRFGQPPVAIVSEKAAQHLFPQGANPIGQFIRVDGPHEPWREVVGLCGDTISYLGEDERNGAVYIPLAQSPQPGMSIVLRSGMPPDSLIPSLRHLLARLAPTVALNSPGSLRAKLDENAGGDVIFLEMLLSTGGVALLLSAAGLYSLIAFTGAQRRREIGIRLALGASAAQLQRMLLAGGLRLTLGALAAGSALGWLSLRLLMAAAGPLPPGAWIRMGIPALLLGMTAAAAVYFPARRASRADPLRVLRAE
jgi:hypothetical protein